MPVYMQHRSKEFFEFRKAKIEREFEKSVGKRKEQLRDILKNLEEVTAIY